MSDVCKHCTNAGCLDACPTGALIRTEFETVVLQADVCNGCGYCIPSCPFGVVDRDPYDGRAAKCTLCYDRLEDGLEPACAKACPTDSIQFGPYDELVETAKGRVVALHEKGVESAYLYGAGDDIGPEQLAGGLGAFFLLTEPPERFGLPAQADSPIQENGPVANLAGVAAAFVAPRARWRAWSSPIAGAAGEPPPPRSLRRKRSCGSSSAAASTGATSRPALGTRGQPGPYRRAVEGAKVALAKPRWGDARWSYLFGPGHAVPVERAPTWRRGGGAARAARGPRIPTSRSTGR